MNETIFVCFWCSCRSVSVCSQVKSISVGGEALWTGLSRVRDIGREMETDWGRDEKT